MAAAVALAAAGTVVLAQSETELRVYAAGSLRAALTEVAQAFEPSAPGTRVRFTFGASGLLKDRIAGGERADVFASANMEHPQALAAAGKAGTVRRFTRNAMCALVAPSVDVTPETLVDRMLDPALKLGTSTPKADPSGDYASMVFERIEQQGRRGAFKQLADKALQLTGGPNSPPPPAGRNVYGELVAQGRADVFLTYCTNATLARTEQPGLRSVAVPPAINVGADYGVAPLHGAQPQAQRFVDFLLGPGAQTIFARHGFAPAADPAGAVIVTGDVKTPVVVDVDALRAFAADAQVSFRAAREVNGQSQNTSVVKGVRLIALLEQAGLAERDRLDWRKTVVIAIAHDGYRAAFSWPELSNTAVGAQAMVGYERDGAPLADGPLVVLAPGDTRTGPRHVKWLQRIEVRVLRD